MHWGASVILAAFVGATLANMRNTAVLFRGHRYQAPSPEFLYRVDILSPDVIRGLRGFQPFGQGWERDDMAFIMARHCLFAPYGVGIEQHRQFQSDDGVFRTAYVSLMIDMPPTVGGGWVYEIRATRNIIDYGDVRTECLALGGIPWSQVRRYRRNFDGASWQDNVDYARGFYEDPGWRHHFRITNEDWRSSDRDRNFPSILRFGIPYQHGSTLSQQNVLEVPQPLAAGVLQRAAADWINGPSGIYRSLGRFPFQWTQRPEVDNAGDSIIQLQPAAPTVAYEDPLDQLHYMAETIANMEREDDYGDWIFSELLDEIDNAGCAAWRAGGRSTPPPQPQRRSASREQNISTIAISQCDKLQLKLKILLLHQSGIKAWENKTTHDKPAPRANEMQLLASGNFIGLDCKVLFQTVQYNHLLQQDDIFSKSDPQTNHDFCVRAQYLARWRKKHEAQQAQIKRPRPAIVIFYGDFRWPEEAKRQGGFLPRNTVPPSPEYKIEGSGNGSHNTIVDWATFILPAFTTFKPSAEQAAGLAARETRGFPGVVYAVHATPNMVNWGNNVTVVGGIVWEQVMGWRQVFQDHAPPTTPPMIVEQDLLRAFQDNKTALFSWNPDYDAKRFDHHRTTTVMKRANSLVTYLRLQRFMDRHGSAVRWTGSFPLFKTDNIVTGAVSKAAKAKNLVLRPHPESLWQEMKSFASRHKALFVLSGIIVACVIPGAGAIIDAAELTALSIESAEMIEMEEASASALGNAANGILDLVKDAAKLKLD